MCIRDRYYTVLVAQWTGWQHDICRGSPVPVSIRRWENRPQPESGRYDVMTNIATIAVFFRLRWPNFQAQVASVGVAEVVISSQRSLYGPIGVSGRQKSTQNAHTRISSRAQVPLSKIWDESDKRLYLLRHQARCDKMAYGTTLSFSGPVASSGPPSFMTPAFQTRPEQVWPEVHRSLGSSLQGSFSFGLFWKTYEV